MSMNATTMKPAVHFCTTSGKQLSNTLHIKKDSAGAASEADNAMMDQSNVGSMSN